MAAEGGSPQSEAGDASGEDPGSPSRPCLHVLSRRRLEQRRASSRASSQQRPAGWHAVSPLHTRGWPLLCQGRPVPSPSSWGTGTACWGVQMWRRTGAQLAGLGQGEGWGGRLPGGMPFTGRSQHALKVTP